MERKNARRMNIFPLVEVPSWLMLTLNIILWPIFHGVISNLTLRMKEHYFIKDTCLYRLKAWEKEGRIYETVFNIKAWKKLVPDGATIFNDGFKKKSLQGTELSYIQTFINETRRAELSHLLQILPFIVFFIFNSFWIAMIMFVYAFAFNVPLIMVQRYNRFRFQKLVKRL